ERGALDGRRLRIARIDLHYPAEAVGLVRVRARVEALVELLPAIAAPRGGDPIAAVVGRDHPAVHELKVPVLLAREIGPPGRPPMRAPAIGAEDQPAGGIGGGPDEGMPGRGAGESTGRAGRDAAGVARGRDDAPRAVALLDLDDRHAHRVLRLQYLVRAPRLLPVGEEESLVEILVVHHE